jgi:hypothetical protein
MADLIAALDNALAATGEDVILRRVVGTAPNTANVDVTCRARVDAMTTEQLSAGILATDLNVIISPTQINNAQWPGGNIPALPPFNIDQRIPREGGPDKVLLRGKPVKTVAFVDAKIINGELVRIDMRVTG